MLQGLIGYATRYLYPSIDIDWRRVTRPTLAFKKNNVFSSFFEIILKKQRTFSHTKNVSIAANEVFNSISFKLIQQINF